MIVCRDMDFYVHMCAVESNECMSMWFVVRSWESDFQGKLAIGALGPFSVSAARQPLRPSGPVRPVRLKAGAAKVPFGVGLTWHGARWLSRSWSGPVRGKTADR